MRKTLDRFLAMRKLTTLRHFSGLLGGLFVSLAFSAWPQCSSEATVTSPPPQPFGHEEREPTTEVKPGLFTNPQGVEVGAVQDFVLDLQAGRIVYTVGVFDQIEKLKNRVFVLPWGVVNVDLEQQTFTLGEHEKSVLHEAPSFPLDTWPALPVAQWLKTVTAYWREKLGDDFATADGPESALYKAGDVVGMTIKNLAGEEVGKIDELMLDPENGVIAYAVLSFDDPQQTDHTVVFALPWNVVRLNLEQHALVADVDRKIFLENREGAAEGLDHGSAAETPQPTDDETQA
jgi:sporulation protein YlmC with PRC-barrel domain